MRSSDEFIARSGKAPPSRKLPGVLPEVQRAAALLASNARPVMIANDALLLSTTAIGWGQATLTTSLWNASCRPLPLVRGEQAEMLRWSLAALEDAARLLLFELARRWPANARPRAIGILTDGSGVAFSSDNPSPLSDHWLAKHQSGRCPTTTLLPFAADSAWTHLIMPSASRLMH